MNAKHYIDDGILAVDAKLAEKWDIRHDLPKETALMFRELEEYREKYLEDTNKITDYEEAKARCGGVLYTTDEMKKFDRERTRREWTRCWTSMRFPKGAPKK